MKATAVQVEFKVELELPVEQWEILFESAQRHYDATCRGVLQPGGTLSGVKNDMQFFNAGQNQYAWAFTVGEIDLLCKIMELHQFPYGLISSPTFDLQKLLKRQAQHVEAIRFDVQQLATKLWEGK